ncbi:MAG: DUF1175 family protein, partial [Deltaproteobacteria bacterium]|nr:DUF1175 family protein [Deltaproteobacteria bacterium]
VEQIDPRWTVEQRDCSGLVRFAYREAFKSLWPERLLRGPWQDRRGAASAFADAETLLAHNFAPLGRDEQAAGGLRSGDLMAFRQGEMNDGPATFHLMLVVTPDDKAHGDTLVIYHPGSTGEEVRIGTLQGLFNDAPREWRPEAQNRSFVGFFRLKDWVTP